METYELETPVFGSYLRTAFCDLRSNGLLTIREGYCWDGPSGPTWDSPAAMRPSLVHDVFYQMIRLGAVPMSTRATIDDFFHKQLLDAGMGRFRAWYYWKAVRMFGKRAASGEESIKQIKCAP